MFIDKVVVAVKAGDGGNGALSFRHEKFIDKGGPDGGDGGNGGNVIFRASQNQNTLAKFRYHKRLQAEHGLAGSKRKKHGSNGNNFVADVPVGTVITNTDGSIIADLVNDKQEVVVALGGKGGFGNAHFVSSTRQAPRIVEKGEKGEEKEILLELKMIADVGLIGLPNAGKSTFLASTSNARPEIADYPFTTLRPNLGVADINGSDSLLIADIPGLIEGASKGKGLGDEFLRHVERTKVLVHLIDIYNDDVVGAYKTIIKELKAYKIDMSSKPQIVVLNKIDGFNSDLIEEKTKKLKKALPRGAKMFTISAQSRAGVKELLYAIKLVVDKEDARIKKMNEKKKSKSIPILTIDTGNRWEVHKSDDGFIVKGLKIEKFAARTDFGNFQGVQRMRDIMKKMGIVHELVRKGAKPGDKVKIGPFGQLEL